MWAAGLQIETEQLSKESKVLDKENIIALIPA